MIAEEVKHSIKFHRLKIRLLWTAVFFLFVYLVYFTITNAGKDTHGFATYYTASKLIMDGESVANFYNDDWFSEKVKEFVPEVYEIYHVNTPITWMVTLPFALLEFNTAKLLWIIFNLSILALTVGFLLNKLDFEIQHSLIIVIMLLCFQPLFANILYGQFYILIFCLLVLIWSAYSSGNEKLLGTLLGFIIVIKLAGMILLVLLAVQRKWKSLLWTCITIVLMVGVSLPFVGFDSWFVYKESLLKYFSSPTLSVTAYQTVHSFFYHFTFYDMQWNPYPLINFPLLGKILTYISATFIIASAIYCTHRIKNADLSFGVFIIAGIILSPASLDYHYLMIIFSFIIFLKYFQAIKSKWISISLILAYILIAAAIPFTSSKVTGGLLALLAYPKLYGSVGLLILFYFLGLKNLRKQETVDSKLNFTKIS